ncbi:hypothetical protein BC939DRAFT_462723 [Gamsiella multidivaricata]|uniref:uncharacterized protein n=1 Tax=Gamsiella multidivaricata TaxID=101098 RepID=UPI00222093E3|nr:uncharacterized protein BC939DRAFT_462723 [Gamsiella multidivaricata]KAI7818521.1 hypothetical protein BC939DRAFT_462723 [Gamsiella multidivaricata]
MVSAIVIANTWITKVACVPLCLSMHRIGKGGPATSCRSISEQTYGCGLARTEHIFFLLRYGHMSITTSLER